MALLTAAQREAELQRKASLGIKPTDSSNMARFNQIKASTPTPQRTTTTASSSSTPVWSKQNQSNIRTATPTSSARPSMPNASFGSNAVLDLTKGPVKGPVNMPNNPNMPAQISNFSSSPSSSQPTPSGFKTVFLDSGGSVVVGPNGQISQFGGQLTPQQASSMGTKFQEQTMDEWRNQLANEFQTGKIKNTFDFIDGKGTQWNTGTTNWSPFAVDLQTAARNAGQIPTPTPAMPTSQNARPVSISSAGSATPNMMSQNANLNSTPTTSMPKLSQDQSNFFNRNFGGIQNYVNVQQGRFNEAVANGDTELISKLQADAARVGYNLSDPRAGAVSNPSSAGTATGTTTFTPNMNGNANDSLFTPFTKSQLEQDIGSQFQREIGDRQRIKDNHISALNTGFGRRSQDINEDRVLEDNRLDRQLNPFSGKSDFTRGILAMQRERTDRERTQDLESRIAQEEAEFSDFLKAAPDKQRELLNEAIRNERTWALDVANSTGFMPDGSRTLAGVNADRDFELGVADRTGVLNGIPTLQAQNQQFQQEQQGFENRFNYGQAIGQFSNGQQTLQKANQEWQQAFEQGQFDLQKAQSIWEQTFKEKSFEQDMKEAAASRGLQWANLSQRQKEFVADQEWRERNFELDSQKQGQSEIDAFTSSLNNLYVTNDENGNPKVTNKTALKNAIIAKNYPDEITDQLLTMYGIPTK